MPEHSVEVLRGTLDLLILKSVSWGPTHGYAVARWLEQATDDVLRIEEGSLYPALHRLENRGWISADWGLSEKNRRAKYYTLTAKGRTQLHLETVTWTRFAYAVFAAHRLQTYPAPCTRRRALRYGTQARRRSRRRDSSAKSGDNAASSAPASCGPRRSVERGEHGVGEACPRDGFQVQLRAPFRRQRVVFGAAVFLRQPPVRRNPAAILEPVERGVKRTLFYTQDIVSGLLEPPSNGVPVRGPPTDGFEDEKVERAAQDFDAVFGHGPIGFLGETNDMKTPVEKQWGGKS